MMTPVLKKVFFAVVFFSAKLLVFFRAKRFFGHKSVFFLDVTIFLCFFLLKIVIIFQELCMKMPECEHHFIFRAVCCTGGVIGVLTFANFLLMFSFLALLMPP